MLASQASISNFTPPGRAYALHRCVMVPTCRNESIQHHCWRNSGSTTCVTPSFFSTSVFHDHSCVSRFECPRSTQRHKRARACTCSLAARRVRKDSAQDRPNPLAWRRERPLARSLQHGGEHALKLRRSEPSRLALPRRVRLVSSGRRAGDGGRRARSRGPLPPRNHHANS